MYPWAGHIIKPDYINEENWHKLVDHWCEDHSNVCDTKLLAFQLVNQYFKKFCTKFDLHVIGTSCEETRKTIYSEAQPEHCTYKMLFPHQTYGKYLYYLIAKDLCWITTFIAVLMFTN